MTKNYYWNQGCKFPITKKDVIDGRCYMFLEAIRKLTFLLENPAAGYYKDDLPSVVWNGTAWTKGPGYLHVYSGGNVYYWDDEENQLVTWPYTNSDLPSWNGTTFTNLTNWRTMFATDYISQPGHARHEKGEYRLWCDGVIYQDDVTSDWISKTAGQYHIWASVTPPPIGGWFAANKTAGAWIKTASKNSYYQWDANAFREINGGLVRSYDLGTDIRIESWSTDAHVWYPKQFDPFEQTRPLYKLPETYLDNGKLLVWEIGTIPALNKYYYYEQKHLWKCLYNETEDVPSLVSEDWQLVNLWPSTDFKNYKFQRIEIEIEKYHFAKESIQGPLYSSQGHTDEKPERGRTQYRQEPGFPENITNSYETDLKITECIMSYIERLFDGHSYAAEVDSDFKSHFHTLCGGVYGGTAYDNYNKALAAGKADLVVSITHPAWCCNESGFEWACKKSGVYSWYFDTNNPYFTDVSGWYTGDPSFDDYTEPNRTQLATAIGLFISKIAGTMRRTYKHSFAKPHESTIFQKSDYVVSRKGLFLGYAAFVNNPLNTIESWYSQTYMDTAAVEYTYNGSSDSFTGTAPPENGATASINLEPTQTYKLGDVIVRDYEIDGLVDIINNIWSILTVEVGYPKSASVSMSIKESTPYDDLEFNGVPSELTAKMKAFIASYATATFGGSTGAVGCGHLISDPEDQYGYRNLVGIAAITKITVTIYNDYTGKVPSARYRIPFLLFNYGCQEIIQVGTNSGISEIDGKSLSQYFNDAGYIDPTDESCALVALGGNIPLSGSVGVRRWSSDPAVVAAKTVQFNPLNMTAVEGGVQAVGYFAANYGGAGLFNDNKVVLKFGENEAEFFLNHPFDIRYTSGKGLTISVLQNMVFIDYDHNFVPHYIWSRDGNWPLLVDSFELPILPPYPNPPFWIRPANVVIQSVDLSDRINTLSGYISNCTSIPSGRIVQYIFRLLTGGFDLGEAEYNEQPLVKYDPELYYSSEDVVYWKGFVYEANDTVYPDEYPGESPFWTKIRAVGGWQLIIDDIEGYEYIDEGGNYYIKLVDDIQDEVQYRLDLSDTQTIQNYLWHYNLAAWITQAKAYEADVTAYDAGKVCLWGSTEIVINEGIGLDLGVSVTRERQTEGEPPVYIDAYTITPNWRWNGNTAEDDEVETANQALADLCELHSYEPTSLVWDEWAKAVTYSTSNGEDMSGLVITPENYEQWLGVKVRATVTLSIGDVNHTFISGWALIIPVAGLGFNE